MNAPYPLTSVAASTGLREGFPERFFVLLTRRRSIRFRSTSVTRAVIYQTSLWRGGLGYPYMQTMGGHGSVTAEWPLPPGMEMDSVSGGNNRPHLTG